MIFLKKIMNIIYITLIKKINDITWKKLNEEIQKKINEKLEVIY